MTDLWSQLGRFVWLRHALLAAGALVAGLVAIASYEAGALSGLERQAVDARFAIRGTQPPDNRVVIVAVDPPTTTAIGVRPPIPRAYYARVLDRVRAANPRLIAIDAEFVGTTDPRDDQALLAAVRRDGPVLLTTEDSTSGPLPVPAGASHAPGGVIASGAVDADPDGVYRRMIYQQVSTRTLPVVAAEQLHVPVAAGDFRDNHAWIDFRGPPNTFRPYSMIDVLQGHLPTSAFAGKVVLIGVTDPAAKDVFVTAASSKPMSGVELQANALTTILAGFPLQPASEALAIVLLLALAALPALLSLRLAAVYVVLAAAGALLAFLIAAQVAFDSGTILPLPDPLLALALGTLAAVAADAYVQRKQLDATLKFFGLLRDAHFFISYRHGPDGSETAANTVREWLTRKFGEDRVFVDDEAIDLGEDWPRRIEEAIATCRAMLVIIGPQWLNTTAADGSRRLEDRTDWVRREIEAALANEHVVVVPVLHDRAQAPSREQLPDAIKGLADCQGVYFTGRQPESWIEELSRRIDKGRLRSLRRGEQGAAAPVP